MARACSDLVPFYNNNNNVVLLRAALCSTASDWGYIFGSTDCMAMQMQIVRSVVSCY